MKKALLWLASSLVFLHGCATPNDTLLITNNYTDSLFLISNNTQESHYHECFFTIDWPKYSTVFDVELLQKAICTKFEIDTNYQHHTTTMAMVFDSCFIDTTKYSVVKQRLFEQEIYNEEDDDNLSPYFTNDYLFIHYVGSDTQKHIITYSFFNMIGLGGPNNDIQDYLTYNYADNHIITIDEIVANKSLVVKELNRVMTEEAYSEYEFDAQAEEMPNVFRISNDSLIFVFQKYVIAPDYLGCPEVGINVRKNPHLLTAYGRKLFGVKKQDAKNN